MEIYRDTEGQRDMEIKTYTCIYIYIYIHRWISVRYLFYKFLYGKLGRLIPFSVQDLGFEV